MKTITTEKKESLLNRIMNKLKNSALGDILFSSTAGTIEQIDEEKQFETVAQNSGLTDEKELKILNKATFDVHKLEKELTSEKNSHESELDKYKVETPNPPARSTQKKSRAIERNPEERIR